MRYFRYVGIILVFLCWGWGLTVGCGKTTPTPSEEPTNEQVTQDGTKTEQANPPDANEPPEPKPEPRPEPKPEPRPEPKPEPRPEPKPEPRPEPNPNKVTYYGNVKAIIENRCVTCHLKGGIAPFPLTDPTPGKDYALVFAQKALIANAVKSRRMPPWLAGKGCNTYTNDISLSNKEIQTITQWVADGAPQGDPSHYKAPPPPPSIKLPRVDLDLKMKKAYKPKKKPDDYRCFVLDWPAKTNKYITGFQVTPGNASIVHHVIAYLAPPGKTSRYTQRDPNGDGYTCYGTAGGSASYSWIGVWAPGMPGAEYPKDTGILVKPGSKIIVQVHYNVSPLNANATDQTSVQFRLADSVKKQAILMPYTDFLSWTSGNGMHIPKDNPDVKHSYSLDPFTLLGVFLPQLKSITIYSVMMHMHALGKTAKLEIEQSGAQCLVDIPRWDFNWQLIYHLQTPITIKSGQAVKISCSWDNSQKNQRYVDGKQQQSRDVNWGDGTGDEMCLGVMYVTCGDGAGGNIPCPSPAEFF